MFTGVGKPPFQTLHDPSSAQITAFLVVLLITLVGLPVYIGFRVAGGGGVVLAIGLLLTVVVLLKAFLWSMGSVLDFLLRLRGPYR